MRKLLPSKHTTTRNCSDNTAETSVEVDPAEKCEGEDISGRMEREHEEDAAHTQRSFWNLARRGRRKSKVYMGVRIGTAIFGEQRRECCQRIPEAE